jgi:hypothetical protein
MPKFTPKFQRQLKRDSDDKEQVKILTQHTQEITDDLAKVITEGLSYDNGSSALYTVNVTSGTIVVLPTKDRLTTVGASVIYSEGVLSTTKYAYNTRGNLTITAGFDGGGTYKTTFLVIYN